MEDTQGDNSNLRERNRHNDDRIPNVGETGSSNGGDNAPLAGDSKYGHRSMGTEPQTSQYRTASEYCQALRQSLWAYQYYQSMQWFHMNTMMSFSSMMNSNFLPNQQTTSNVNANTTTTPVQQVRRPNREESQPRNGAAGIEYRLASLPQRVIAELIDFLLLFMVKLGVTMIAIEQLGILDLDQYEARFEKILQKDLDYRAALNLTSDLIALEVLNRIFICFFEALCLRRGIGRVGGATPGKRLLGIRVVSCLYVLDVGEDRIRVVPAQNIGFWNALVRSVIKNFSLTFFFPACFTALMFHHNRAVYDHIANCVVVKDIERRR